MKASPEFGLGSHARFLMAFMLRAILLDEGCNVGDIIIRLWLTNLLTALWDSAIIRRGW